MFFSETDLSDFIEENDVKFIRMTFCDTFGNMKNIAIMPRELHRAITDGIPFNATGLLEASHQNLLLNRTPLPCPFCRGDPSPVVWYVSSVNCTTWTALPTRAIFAAICGKP